MSVVLRPRPPLGSSAPWEFPAFTRIGLPNGVAGLLCHLPGRPVLHVRLVLPGGAGLEEPGRAGAGAVLAAAMAEGRRSGSSDDWAVALEAFGGTFSAGLGWDALEVVVTVPGGELRPALELVAELLAAPGLRDEDVARVQQRHVAALSVQFARPLYRASAEFAVAAFEPGTRHAAPLPGTIPGLLAADPEYIRALWSSMADPTQATVVVAGDLAGVRIEEGLAATLGAWRDPPLARQADVAAIHLTGGGTLRLVDLPDATQTTLVVGGVSSAVRPDDLPAVEAAVHYLGGFGASRLPSRIRDGMAASYGAEAGLARMADCSVLGLASSVVARSTGAVAQAFLDELAEARAGRVDPAIVPAAVQNLVAGATVRYTSPAAVAGALARLVTEGLPDDHYARMRRTLVELTVDDVAEALARCTAGIGVCGAAVGPASQVRESLGALGLELVEAGGA